MAKKKSKGKSPSFGVYPVNVKGAGGKLGLNYGGLKPEIVSPTSTNLTGGPLVGQVIFGK
jgi:hypothetical protein